MKRLLIACLLLAAACGGEEVGPPLGASPDVQGPAAPTPVPTPEPTPPPCSPEKPGAPGKEAAVEGKPTITIPDGDPPCELVIHDIKDGTGAEAKATDSVTVQYVGVAWSTKKQFDSSWDRGEPATFPINGVIQGWQEGIPGMKEGGRRRLIIPPAKGYGTRGAGADIGPNETLVFIVDMVKVGG